MSISLQVSNPKGSVIRFFLCFIADEVRHRISRAPTHRRGWKYPRADESWKRLITNPIANFAGCGGWVKEKSFRSTSGQRREG
jgi:hypothetical protein